MEGFSIIICTYDPNREIFSRLLDAIDRFDDNSIAFELIIIDNNSAIPVGEDALVKAFIDRQKQARIIVERMAGLTAARIAGIREARYDWIIFFDDDNEPAPDYLIKARTIIEQYPQAGAWGPGTIAVIYTANNDPWLDTKKDLFQQRNDAQTAFSAERSWQAVYPFGTGLIIKGEIAISYSSRVKAGQYTLTDRKGKSLASGGDVQMVLTAIDLGFSAGTIAGLCLNHLIDPTKATISYLVKQQYGTASAYIKAYNQVFPNHGIKVTGVSNTTIIKKIYSLYRIQRFNMNRCDFKLLLATKMGECNAVVLAMGTSKPWALKWYEKMINA